MEYQNSRSLHSISLVHSQSWFSQKKTLSEERILKRRTEEANVAKSYPGNQMELDQKLKCVKELIVHSEQKHETWFS